MLFDLRGRRKRVVQVTYAILAFLMAASLFFVVGPVNFDSLIGGGSSSSAGSVLNDQAQQIEQMLARDPKNETLLLRDARIRYSAANSQIQTDPSTGAQTGITQEGLDDFQKAGDAWIRYMKLQPKQPDPNVAQLAATSLIYSSSLSELNPRVKGAVQAQAIYAKARPRLNSYLTLAQYSYLSGDFAGGAAAGRKASAAADKSQRKAVASVLAQYRKQGKQIQKQFKASTKFNPNGSGKQGLQNPVGGLSGGGAGLSSPTP